MNRIDSARTASDDVNILLILQPFLKLCHIQSLDKVE